MKSQLLCLMVVAFAATSYGMVFDCVDRNNCDRCPPMVENCKNVAKCGCCDVCQDTLQKGESCVMSILMATLSQKKCGHGLMCDQESMTCLPKSDVMAKLFPEIGNAVVTQQHQFPKAVGCNGTVCFCTHESKQLEQYELLKLERVTAHSCNCGFEKEEYQRTKLIGKLFNCNEQGGYGKMQCKGSVCYCVNEAGLRVNEKHFGVGEIEDNTC